MCHETLKKVALVSACFFTTKFLWERYAKDFVHSNDHDDDTCASKRSKSSCSKQRGSLCKDKGTMKHDKE